MSAIFEKTVLEKLGQIDTRLTKIEKTQDDTLEHLKNFEKFTILKFQEHDEKFNKIDERFDKIDKKLEEIDERFDKIDKKFEEIDERFDKIDKKFDEIDERFEKVDRRFEEVDKRFEELETEIKEMAKGMQVTKEAVILMEQKISLEIPVLFDGYSMHQEKQERQECEIDSINNKIASHDARISCLEGKAI